MDKKKKKFRLTYTQIIALSFFCVIFVGTALLCLPFSSSDGKTTPFVDALFTATSATCVTGLTVQTTAAHWSIFGQIVILLLIQIGGLGLMTLLAVMSLVLNKQLGLQGRRLVVQSAGSLQLGDTDKLVKIIIIGTFSFEAFGASLLSIRFCPEYGVGKGVYYAVFHAVSAFCNAGFDIIGDSSFIKYRSDLFVNLVLMALIIIGGLGFYVWTDIARSRLKPSALHLQSKLVLSVTGILLLSGAVVFFITEKDHSMAGLPLRDRILASCFQSVTMRTAGFYTVDQAHLSQAGVIASSALMLIGGSSGSTAGGLKTTTVAVAFASAFCAGRKVSDVTVFKRRIEEATVKQAAAICQIYFTVLFAASGLLCVLEPLSLAQSLFEVASAIGTVGLSMGVTPTLSTGSRLLIVALMFAGRIGGLSMVSVFAEKRRKPMLERPAEKILIG